MKSGLFMLEVFCCSILLVAALSAQHAQSEPLARELTGMMVDQKLGAVAIKDPDTPDRFVAALVFPDIQLLVVSARYPVPSILEDELARKQYQDVYAALQQTPLQETKIYFQDLKADGLHAKSDASVDAVVEGRTDETVFDGHPGKKKLSEAAYMEKFAASDALYARLLTLLVESMKRTGPATR
jgi:hypothetical protein